jgi:hypothetical protein
MTSPGSTTSALQRLQQWYNLQCDQEWEHSCGVEIDTLDNPGWSLKIDLTSAPLQYKAFSEAKENYEHETKWITCFVRDGKFMGACGSEKLEEMVEIFLDWAEET